MRTDIGAGSGKPRGTDFGRLFQPPGAESPEERISEGCSSPGKGKGGERVVGGAVVKERKSKGLDNLIPATDFYFSVG